VTWFFIICLSHSSSDLRLRFSGYHDPLPSPIALAGLAGASFAHAEIEGLSIKAKVDFESEYVFRGKEHSDKNVQTKVVGEYALPVSGANASVYAGASFWWTIGGEGYRPLALSARHMPSPCATA